MNYIYLYGFLSRSEFSLNPAVERSRVRLVLGFIISTSFASLGCGRAEHPTSQTSADAANETDIAATLRLLKDPTLSIDQKLEYLNQLYRKSKGDHWIRADLDTTTNDILTLIANGIPGTRKRKSQELESLLQELAIETLFSLSEQLIFSRLTAQQLTELERVYFTPKTSHKARKNLLKLMRRMKRDKDLSRKFCKYLSTNEDDFSLSLAVQAIGQLKEIHVLAVDTLQEFASNPKTKPELQIMTARIIGKQGDSKLAISILKQIVNSNKVSASLRSKSYEALAIFESEDSIDVFIKGLKEHSLGSLNRLKALYQSEKISKEQQSLIVSELKILLLSESYPHPEKAASFLAVLASDNRQIISFFIEVIQDPENDIIPRVMSLRGLAAFAQDHDDLQKQFPELEIQLIEVSQETGHTTSPYIRRWSSFVLGYLESSTSIVSALRNLKKDENSKVGREAAFALYRSGKFNEDELSLLVTGLDDSLPEQSLTYLSLVDPNHIPTKLLNKMTLSLADKKYLQSSLKAMTIKLLLSLISRLKGNSANNSVLVKIINLPAGYQLLEQITSKKIKPKINFWTNLLTLSTDDKNILHLISLRPESMDQLLTSQERKVFVDKLIKRKGQMPGYGSKAYLVYRDRLIRLAKALSPEQRNEVIRNNLQSHSVDFKRGVMRFLIDLHTEEKRKWGLPHAKSIIELWAMDDSEICKITDHILKNLHGYPNDPAVFISILHASTSHNNPYIQRRSALMLMDISKGPLSGEILDLALLGLTQQSSASLNVIMTLSGKQSSLVLEKLNVILKNNESNRTKLIALHVVNTIGQIEKDKRASRDKETASLVLSALTDSDRDIRIEVARYIVATDICYDETIVRLKVLAAIPKTPMQTREYVEALTHCGIAGLTALMQIFKESEYSEQIGIDIIYAFDPEYKNPNLDIKLALNLIKEVYHYSVDTKHRVEAIKSFLAVAGTHPEAYPYYRIFMKDKDVEVRLEQAEHFYYFDQQITKEILAMIVAALIVETEAPVLKRYYYTLNNMNNKKLLRTQSRSLQAVTIRLLKSKHNDLNVIGIDMVDLLRSEAKGTVPALEAYILRQPPSKVARRCELAIISLKNIGAPALPVFKRLLKSKNDKLRELAERYDQQLKLELEIEEQIEQRNKLLKGALIDPGAAVRKTTTVIN